MTQFDIKIRIKELYELLQSTDYKIVKCYESSLVNEPLPYDIAALKAQRDAWREEINTLQNTKPEPYKGPAIVWEYRENKTIDSSKE